MNKRDSQVTVVGGLVVLALFFGLYRWADSLRSQRSVAAVASRPVHRAEPATQSLADRSPAELSGIVRDPQRRVLAGAKVCASCASCEPTIAPRGPCVSTDVTGHYAFADVVPGGYFVTAEARGFAPSSAHSGRPVFVSAAERRTDLDIQMAGAAAALTGTVLDATGGTIAHAKLRAVRIDEPRFVLESESDDEGRFAFDLSPGFVMLMADYQGYAPLRVGQTVPAAKVELVLTPGSVIEGVAVEAGSGALLSGVEVQALPQQARDVGIYRSAITDQHGAFAIDGLEAGGYLLVAKAARHQGRLPQAITLGLAEHLRGVEIPLVPAAEVRGRVVEADRESPCRRGYVVLGPPSPILSLADAPKPGDLPLGPQQIASIESDGDVRFLGVPPGFYYVFVQCFDHTFKDGPRALNVTGEAMSDLVWHVAEGGRIQIEVVDASGQPVPRAGLAVRWPRPDPDRPTALMPATADERGFYTLSGASFGRYEVGPAVENDGPIVFAEPSATQPQVAVKLTLAGSGTIAVQVTNADGVTADDVRVFAWPREQDGAAVAAADTPAPTPLSNAVALGAGRFRIGPLRAGAYFVRADDGVNAPVYADPFVQVADGHVTQVALMMQRGGSIRGRVRDEAGDPVPNVWVTATNEPVPGSKAALPNALLPFGPRGGGRALTDLAGAFHIDHLDSSSGARFKLLAEQPGGGSAARTGVEAGSEVEIELPALGSISGVALGEDGRPLQQTFSVRAFNPATGSTREASFQGQDGRFELTDVVPGPLQLTARSDANTAVELTVDLAPKQHLAALRLELRTPIDSEPTPPQQAAQAGP